MADFESSGNLMIDKIIRNWLKWNVKGSKSYQDVYEMVKEHKWKELEIIVDECICDYNLCNSEMGPIPESTTTSKTTTTEGL